jgi:WD repeat-containing protein 76
MSKEIFSTSSQDILITSIDFSPQGHEMWISDGIGGVTHYDLRQDKNKARWYGLSDKKIGSVSVNPTRPHYLLTASNSRVLRQVHVLVRATKSLTVHV